MLVNLNNPAEKLSVNICPLSLVCHGGSENISISVTKCFLVVRTKTFYCNKARILNNKIYYYQDAFP